MKTFRVQRFTTSVVIPVNNDTEDAPVLSGNSEQLNGILKGITINAPNLSGTAFTLWILGQRGETLFTKASLVENGLNYIGVDANNHPLSIPLSLRGVSPLRIKSTGTTDATGVLTFDNAGPIVDGQLVTIGDQVYRAKTALAAANDFLIEPDVAAVGTITSDNTNPDATGTITVDDQTYTLVAAFSAGPTVPNEVIIGIDADTTLANLKAAINGTGTEGVEYSVGTAQPTTPVTAGNIAAHALPITADTAGTSGNSIVLSESATHITVDGAGFLGGTTPGAWSGDDTLQNLSDAIELEDGAGQSGVKYHAGTPANAYVTAGDVAAHAITVTAVDGIDDPADVDTLSTVTVFTWGAATLTGGGELSARTFNVDLLIDRG